ncbi:MAG: phosphosulfolactate synthase [Nanoarchaeota archaeon]
MTIKRAFDFVKILEGNSKPRSSGVIEIRGSYYTPVVYSYLHDLFEIAGEFVDGFKFAGGSQRLHPIDVVKKIISLCHDNNVYVSTGGFIERVAVEGPEAVDMYLEECKNLGFDVVEVSSGLAPIPLDDKVEIVKQVHKLGLKAKPEISFMVGAGAGTKIANYKPKLRTMKDVVNEIESYLKLHPYMFMFESEGVTEDLPSNKWRTDIIETIVKKFGLKRWMFEAAEPSVFKWYLKKFGPEVNLFIDHSQIIEFQAWRSKLWGDPDIWKGKKIRYKK